MTTVITLGNEAITAELPMYSREMSVTAPLFGWRYGKTELTRRFGPQRA
jgi:hypothetical protein